MKAPRSVSWLVIALMVAACGKKDSLPADEVPSPPRAVTPESVPVLALVELPSGQDLGSAGAVVDMLSPGASSMAAAALPGMLAGLVQAQSLDGAHLDRPVRVIVLDPKQHPEPAVLLVAVADEDRLAKAVGPERLVARDRMALIGAPGAVAAARAYALDGLAREPAPDRPRAVAFMGPILDSFRDEIVQARTQIGAMMAMLAQSQGQGGDASHFVQLYMDALLALLEQTGTVALTLAGRGGFAGIDLDFGPRADTPFAGFVRAQQPADFALLGTLPATESPAMIMAGHLRAGPAHDALVALGKDFLAAMFGGTLGQELGASMDAWMDLYQGDFAGWMSSPLFAMRMAYLLTVEDSARAAALGNQLGQAMAAQAGGMQILGMRQTTTYRPEAFTHDGVAVAEQHGVIDLDSVSPEQRAAMERMGGGNITSYIAGFDRYMGIASGQPENMRALIDAARGKAPGLGIEGQARRALDLARARQDSVFLVMDLAALASAGEGPTAPGMPRGIVMSLGFAGGTGAGLFIGLAGADD